MEKISRLRAKEKIERTIENAATPEEFLASIDFVALNDIISTLRRRSGVLREYNEISPESFFFDEPEQYEDEHGRTIVVEGKRVFKTGKIVVGWEEDVPSNIRNLRALRTLIHESLHDQSFPQAEDIEYLPEDHKDNLIQGQVTPRLKNGFAELQQRESGTYVRQNTPLNEAVTETLALDVMNEYLRRTGQENVITKEIANEIDFNYYEDRVVLQIVIKALADRLGMSDTDMVWKAFVSSYFSQENKPNELISMVHAEIWSGNPLVSRLVSEMSTGKSVQERGDIGKVLHSIADSEFHKQRITEALEKIASHFGAENISDALNLRQ